MKHEKIKELLPLYIDDVLTDKEKKLIENHLQECEECKEELNKYRDNQKLLSSLNKETAPADFVESILNKVTEKTKEEHSANNSRETFLKKVKDFFVLPVKVPAGLIGLAVVILLISITGLPTTILNNSNFQTDNKSIEYYSENYTSSPETYSTLDTARTKTAESSPQQNVNLQTDSLNDELKQKIIKRANLIIELSDIDDVNNNIINLVEEYSGYISNSRNWFNQYKQKFFWYELKVPADKFNLILERLASKEYGQIISRNISSNDVTEEYMDLDIRLENLLSQEARYRQLLDKAAEVEDILKIENELNRIRTEVERLQGRKKYLDKQISYSTISVEFRQPEPISSGTSGIIQAIRNAASKMVIQFYKIIILIGIVIPYLLTASVGYLVYKKSRHK